MAVLGAQERPIAIYVGVRCITIGTTQYRLESLPRLRGKCLQMSTSVWSNILSAVLVEDGFDSRPHHGALNAGAPCPKCSAQIRRCICELSHQSTKSVGIEYGGTTFTIQRKTHNGYRKYMLIPKLMT